MKYITNTDHPEEAYKRLFAHIIDEAYSDCKKFKLSIIIEADASNPDVATIDFTLQKVALVVKNAED
jgi:hypothetical protein